jgi:hypothetical protein
VNASAGDAREESIMAAPQTGPTALKVQSNAPTMAVLSSSLWTVAAVVGLLNMLGLDIRLS